MGHSYYLLALLLLYRLHGIFNGINYGMEDGGGGAHTSPTALGLGIIVCLFGLILYVQSTIFQLYRDGSSLVEQVS